MKLFLDTADIAQIREAWSWGIIGGVTTNPSHVLKAGRKPLDIYTDILDIVDGPVSLETVMLSAPEIITEGRELAKLHKNVVVKVPLLKEGLKAVKVLSAEGIKTNVTVTFSPLQALLAAKCGATYVSPFVGRLDASVTSAWNWSNRFGRFGIIMALKHRSSLLPCATRRTYCSRRWLELMFARWGSTF